MSDGQSNSASASTDGSEDFAGMDAMMASMASALESAGLGSMLETEPEVAPSEPVVVEEQVERTAPANVFPELEEVDDEAEMVNTLLTVGEERSRKGDSKGALAAFNKAIALDPSCDMAWFNRGVLLEAQQDARGARQAFTICLDLNDQHAPATANLAILLERIGDLEGAFKMATKALDFFPGHPSLIEVQTRCKDSGVNIPISEITKPTEETHTYDESVVVKAMDAVGVSDRDAVVAEAKHHDYDGNNHLDYEEMVSAAEVVAATEEAIAVTASQPAAQPQPQPQPVSEPTPVVEPAPVVEPTPQPVVQAQPEQVAVAPQPVIETPTIDLDALCAEAKALVQAGDAKSGLSILKPHLKTLAAQHAPSWLIAGGAMARMDLDSHAINAISHSLSIDPSQANGWYNLATIQSRNGDNASAITNFGKALSLKPDYQKACEKLADLTLGAGDIEGYITAMRSLLQIDAGNQRRTRYVEILLSIAEGESQVLENVAGIPPTLPEGPVLAREALSLMGQGVSEVHARAYSAAQDHINAVSTWKELIKADKENPQLWLGLSASLNEAGDYATAEKCKAKANALMNPQAHVQQVAQPVAQPAPQPVAQPIPATLPEPAPPAPAPVPVAQPAPAPLPEPAPPQSFVESPASILLEPVAQPAPSPAMQEQTQVANDLLMTPIESRPVERVAQANPTVDLAAAALEAAASVQKNVMGEVNSKSVANQDISWYNQGIQLLEDGKYREALSCFDRALPSFAGDDEMVIRILNGRGHVFYHMEEYPKCVEAYHQAMLIRPTEVRGQTLYNMGTAYAEMQRYPDAIKCFEQAIPRGLSNAEAKRAKDQIRRCNILYKEMMKKK